MHATLEAWRRETDQWAEEVYHEVSGNGLASRCEVPRRTVVTMALCHDPNPAFPAASPDLCPKFTPPHPAPARSHQRSPPSHGANAQALSTLPSYRLRPFAFPPLHDVLDIVRTLLDLSFRPGIDAAVNMSYNHTYAMMAGFSPCILGKWDPHLPMLPPQYDEEQDMLVYK